MSDDNIKIIAKGIPVSSGKVIQKEAVVITARAEFHKIKKKKDVILVVNNFDPSYDILLPHCAGIISEVGTLLCHLAIVARMFKIPAVVNAKNVVKLVNDGDIVSLDADNGILYIKTRE